MGSGSSRRRGAAGRGAAENRELLRTALPQCQEAAGLPAPGGIIPPARDGGGCGEAAAAGGGGSPPELAALSSGSPPGPENNTADHHSAAHHDLHFMEPRAPASRDDYPDSPACSPPSSLQGQGGTLACQLPSPLLSPGGQDQVNLLNSVSNSGPSLQKNFHCSPSGRCPQSDSKKPSGQSTISYDYSEEELMASIEREYCR